MRKKYIIDKEDLYKLIKGEVLTLTNDNAFSVEVNGTLTNGDVIKAMFPWECRDIDDNYKVSIFVNNGTMRFNKDWWNAPYGGEKR